MERHERICGACALLAVVGLAATAGCGNSVSELLEPLPATMIVSDTGHHDALTNRAAKTAATSGHAAQPGLVSGATDCAERSNAHPTDQPQGGLEINECEETAFTGEPRSGAGSNCIPGTVRTRARDNTPSGSQPAKPCNNDKRVEE